MAEFDLYSECDNLFSPESSGQDDSDSDDTLDSLVGDHGTSTPKRARRSNKPCKYVPHAEKAPHLVQRRNARERRRVQAVNSAFVKLRKVVPYENKHKRLSKVKTLRTAIEYIRQLQDLIQNYDCGQQQQPADIFPSPPYDHPWMKPSSEYHTHNQGYYQSTTSPHYSRENCPSSRMQSPEYSHHCHDNYNQHYRQNGHNFDMRQNAHPEYYSESNLYTQRAAAHLAMVS